MATVGGSSRPGSAGKQRPGSAEKRPGTAEGSKAAPSLAKDGRRASFAARNNIPTFKFSAALEHAGDIPEESYNFEDFRISVKKFFTQSEFGRYYENFLIFLSVVSSLEFIYSTYLHRSIEADRKIIEKLEIVELMYAIIFGSDWALGLFLAEHRVIYLTRYLSLSLIFNLLVSFKTLVIKINYFVSCSLLQFLLHGRSDDLRAHLRDLWFDTAGYYPRQHSRKFPNIYCLCYEHDTNSASTTNSTQVGPNSRCRRAVLGGNHALHYTDDSVLFCSHAVPGGASAAV
jgi:hypothetical protein